MDQDNPVLVKASYKIDDLIANSVQPFEDLPDEELEALAKDLDPRAGLPIAVVSSDGVVIDGLQRLRALKLKGRVNVPRESLVVEMRANKANAIDWSIRLNVNRRHLSGETKAKAMIRLMDEHGWSQGVVAEKFNMTRQGVSHLIKTYISEEDQTSPLRVGRDGVVRDTSAISGTPKPRQTGPRGYIYADGSRDMTALAKVIGHMSVLKIVPDRLPADEQDRIREQLINAKDVITMRLAELDGELYGEDA
jgi:hypothetical protein